MATIIFHVDWSIMTTEQINFKALNGQVNIDEAQGIVECFVAAIGNKDSVGDVVKSGAFTESLKRRKPRVVWGHSWNDPIGKVLEIYEVPPTDSRLPMKMKMAGVGGLYAKVQFNLATEKGREAFASVAFFGHEQEWSIGYKTLNATFDPNMQANVLHEVELYEVSPVLHGANQLTGTLSVKSDDAEKCDMPGRVSVVARPIFPNAPKPSHEQREQWEKYRNQYRRQPQAREREDIFEEGEARPLSDEARTALALLS
jgi:HK97 family phage prohead protease